METRETTVAVIWAKKQSTGESLWIKKLTYKEIDS